MTNSEQWTVWYASESEWALEPYDDDAHGADFEVYPSFTEARAALLSMLRGSRDAYNDAIRYVRNTRREDWL